MCSQVENLCTLLRVGEDEMDIPGSSKEARHGEPIRTGHIDW